MVCTSHVVRYPTPRQSVSPRIRHAFPQCPLRNSFEALRPYPQGLILISRFKIGVDEHSCHACHIQQRSRSKGILCQPVHEMLHRDHDSSEPFDLSISRYSVAPRRLGWLSAGRLFLPCDLLSCAVTRDRVAGPNPELANEDTSRRMVSMEEDCSVSFGSVSPRSCHRIFGFNTARFFFLPVLRPFHTVEIFMACSLYWATGLFSGSYSVTAPVLRLVSALPRRRQRDCPSGERGVRAVRLQERSRRDGSE